MYYLGYTYTIINKNNLSEIQNQLGTGSDIDILSRIIYAEGGNQSEECMEVIGRTVLNRVLHTGYPNSISGVVYEVNHYKDRVVYQFSPVENGSINNSSSEKCYEVARELLQLWDSGEYEVGEFNIIAFEACGPGYSHSSWCDYAFTIDDVSFYTAR